MPYREDVTLSAELKQLNNVTAWWEGRGGGGVIENWAIKVPN